MEKLYHQAAQNYVSFWCYASSNAAERNSIKQ
jgi:hypothetical protein